MNANLFDEMVSGLVDAKKYRAGQKTKLRVSRMAFEPVEMKPAQTMREETQRRRNRKPRHLKSKHAVRHSGMKQKPALETRQGRGIQTSNRLAPRPPDS